jgi:hypothetical protein
LEFLWAVCAHAPPLASRLIAATVCSNPNHRAE